MVSRQALTTYPLPGGLCFAIIGLKKCCPVFGDAAFLAVPNPSYAVMAESVS